MSYQENHCARPKQDQGGAGMCQFCAGEGPRGFSPHNVQSDQRAKSMVLLQHGYVGRSCGLGARHGQLEARTVGNRVAVGFYMRDAKTNERLKTGALIGPVHFPGTYSIQ
ncbi:uncharacterized protein N7500_008949 [Penicillium coprophilum]|uniref:uncharacterized protein n=1 Tax=Penicillium coprophilum TaxID=36646 RepID=UPI0023A6D76F|nr:uncharacterized protein N7500_008949 [Penicillium coprophilum]KAJ5159298.1 hypothetical protein N7500_008949 [Penicillium coprophilum]